MCPGLFFCIRFFFIGFNLLSFALLSDIARAYAEERNDGKTLILYYSRSGNTRAASEVLQRELRADMVEIKDCGNRGPGFGIVMGMLKTILNLNTDTDPATVDLAPYKTVIVAAPIWAAKFGLAMRSFVERNRFDGKRVIIFITADVFIEEKYQKKHRELIEASGGTVAGYFQVQATDLVDGKKKPRSRETIIAETIKLIPHIKQAIAGAP
ncbi:MAG: hypothetical protein N3B18_05840 [Desulfobacterota bacterium]|nr:hypothetical protein [Thermodesulfobacteriota bacterium]